MQGYETVKARWQKAFRTARRSKQGIYTKGVRKMIIKQAGYTFELENVAQAREWIQHELDKALEKIQVVDDSGNQISFRATVENK